MPKIVDHEQRRNEIVATYLKLVERDGINGASSRALAAELGISNSLLWRYFDDMDALVERAYSAVVAHTNSRVGKAIQDQHGLTAVYALIDELFPVTQESKAEARVVVEYWATKARNKNSYVEPHNCWRLNLIDFLEEARCTGEIAEDAPTSLLADIILDIVGNSQTEYAMSGDDHIALAARDLAREVVYLRRDPKHPHDPIVPIVGR